MNRNGVRHSIPYEDFKWHIKERGHSNEFLVAQRIRRCLGKFVDNTSPFQPICEGILASKNSIIVF